jgi:hypothetical protein
MTRTEDHNRNNHDNHNNNNDNNHDKLPLSQARVSEEAAIFNTFALIVRNKFVLTPSPPSDSQGQQSKSSSEHKDSAQERINRLDELYSNPEYNAEKRMLQKMNNNGMVYGLACGVLTFGLLRSGPRLMQRYLNRRLMNQRGGGSTSKTVGGYTFDQSSATTGGIGASGGASKGFSKPGGIVLRTLKLGLDLTVSLFIAAYGSLVFVDRKKLMDDMSKIPLVEGRSLVSDKLCDEFVDVYRRIPKKTWEKYQGKSDALDAIGGFVKNCLRREIVERKILEKRRGFGMHQEGEDDGTLMMGTNGNEPKRSQRWKRHVSIPSPGVSPDIPVRIEWIDNQSEDVIVGRERSLVLGNNGVDDDGDDGELNNGGRGGGDYMGNFDDEDDFSNFDDFTSQDDENTDE